LRNEGPFAYDIEKITRALMGRFGQINAKYHGIRRKAYILHVFAVAVGLFSYFFSSCGWADYPRPWQMYYQNPVTPIMEHLYDFHHLLLVIEGLIVFIVAALLIFVVFRFRASKNPTPSKTAHNTLLEIIWTTIPVLILVFIAFPSFKILYMMDVTPKADLTIKAIGNQWYWTYEYPDQNIKFDSNIIPENQLKPGQLRLFEVDNRVLVPVNTNVRVITTSSDVVHSWAVPAFGIKRDSVPGRLNETWFNVKKEGVYYGQCSELCGVKHGFMPIVVEAVSKEKFDAWVASKKSPPLSSAGG
jgi:cytochrome c oxidase subunit 2